MLALTLTAPCSCFGAVDESGDVLVVIENRDGSFTEYDVFLENVENKNKGAAGVLEHLAAQDKNPLAVDMSNDSYGKYISSIGTLVPDAASGEYICIYTSAEADFGTWDGVGEIMYGEVKLMMSGAGISYMTVTAGTAILFRIETF